MTTIKKKPSKQDNNETFVMPKKPRTTPKHLKAPLLNEQTAQELAKFIMEKDGFALTRINTHEVNGETRWLVHVTYINNVSPAVTHTRML